MDGGSCPKISPSLDDPDCPVTGMQVDYELNVTFNGRERKKVLKFGLRET